MTKAQLYTLKGTEFFYIKGYLESLHTATQKTLMGVQINDLGQYKECLQYKFKYYRVTFKNLDVNPLGQASIGICVNPIYTATTLKNMISMFALVSKLKYLDIPAI